MSNRLTIPFTQYLRPNGCQREAGFDATGEIAALAQTVLDRGWRFGSEVLTTGEVSLTVFDPDKQEDVAIEIAPNGPGVVVAVARLVRAAAEAAKARAKTTKKAPGKRGAKGSGRPSSRAAASTRKRKRGATADGKETP